MFCTVPLPASAQHSAQIKNCEIKFSFWQPCTDPQLFQQLGFAQFAGVPFLLPCASAGQTQMPRIRFNNIWLGFTLTCFLRCSQHNEEEINLGSRLCYCCRRMQCCLRIAKYAFQFHGQKWLCMMSSQSIQAERSQCNMGLLLKAAIVPKQMYWQSGWIKKISC